MINKLENKEKGAGQSKVEEYISRIKGGESKEGILDGLPESFRSAIEAGLVTPPEESPQEMPIVPPQYEGLPTDLLEEFMVVKEYIGDPEKTQREKERKRRAVEYVREKERKQSEQEEISINEGERIEEVRESMGLPLSVEPVPETVAATTYSEFKLSSGETDEGAFWHQYRNEAAKELKESGKFEWGKERIYFDVGVADMIKLRNIVIRIASENNIPIAFKFMDAVKTTPAQRDGKETRFVANFASEDDAKIFFDNLKQNLEYQSLLPDRNIDYKGIRLDKMAEYASGYREARGALERIMSGVQNNDGTYSYQSESGRSITIPEDQYNSFKNSYNEMQAKINKTKQEWGV